MKHAPIIFIGLSILLSACQATPSSMENESTQLSSSEMATTVLLQWELDEVPQPGKDEPLTDARVILTGAVHDEIELGNFLGTGFAVEGTDWDQAPGALTTAIVWWAGGGEELSVHRNENGDLVMRARSIDEELGYGDFSDLKTVPLDPALEVRVVE